MGPAGLRQFLGRAARDGHLPSGQSRISGPDGLDGEGEARRQDGRGRLSRHARRHRQPHDDGQRPRRARLGRRRHRGRGCDARPAALHAPAGGDRLPAARGLARGRHRDGPRADRHADAAQEGRRRQVRGILRPRPQRDDGRRPRDARQHGPRIWRDLRALPDRRADARLPQDLRPQARAHRARRGLRQGAGHVPDAPHARSAFHRHAGTRSRRGDALARRARSVRRTASCSPRPRRASPRR